MVRSIPIKIYLEIHQGDIYRRAIASAFAPNVPSFIIFVALQGAGAAANTPGSIRVLTSHFPPGNRRSQAFGILGAGQPIGFILGLIAGQSTITLLTVLFETDLRVPKAACFPVIAPPGAQYSTFKPGLHSRSLSSVSSQSKRTRKSTNAIPKVWTGVALFSARSRLRF